MILELPLELQQRIIYGIEGIDVLNLTLTCKYFFKQLGFFRTLANWLKTTLVWPSLNFNPNHEITNDELQLFKDFKFRFKCVTVTSNYYRQIQHIVKTKLFALQVDSQDNLTDYTMNGNLKSIQVNSGKAAFDFTAFSKFRDLHCLSLSNNRINDHQLISFFSNIPQSLTVLDLYMNCITDTGAVFLSTILPYTNLNSLILCRNRINVAGLRALSQCISYTKLTHLDITENTFSNTDWKILFSSIENTKLEILNIKIYDFQSLQVITCCIKKSNLKKIIVEIPADCLERFLIACIETKLESIIFDGYRISFLDQSASILSKYIDKLPITSLELTYCKIESELNSLFKAISKSKIENLTMENFRSKDLTSVGLCISQSKLKSLRLISPDMDDSMLCTLLADIKQSNLHSLNLCRNKFSDQGVLFFCSGMKHSKLRLLNFSHKSKLLGRIRSLLNGSDLVVRLNE
ncbi:hypothetical protein HDV04_001486 [Boothiomyces sp. JEL0838]|nr:hypothetical protein HDV04_001486 [Boothiomyces sp. JEL0838]